LADNIYQQVFYPTKIERHHIQDQHPDDLLKHIDATIYLPAGNLLTIQEKKLRAKYVHFNTLTIEYHQNRFTLEKGEFFNLHAHLIMCAYTDHDENPTALQAWYIISIPNLFIWLQGIHYEDYIKPNYNSNASFIALPFRKIPSSCVVASSTTKEFFQP